MIRAALACVVLALTATAAFAEGAPISATAVGIDHDPGGNIASHRTDASGSTTFASLRPGRYAVVLRGRDVVAAIGRIEGTGGHRASRLTIAIAIGRGAPASHEFDLSGAWNVSEGIRVGFTIPGRAGNSAAGPVDVRVTIFDRWGNY